MLNNFLGTVSFVCKFNGFLFTVMLNNFLAKVSCLYMLKLFLVYSYVQRFLSHISLSIGFLSTDMFNGFLSIYVWQFLKQIMIFVCFAITHQFVCMYVCMFVCSLNKLNFCWTKWHSTGQTHAHAHAHADLFRIISRRRSPLFWWRGKVLLYSADTYTCVRIHTFISNVLL
jgi:hypothetical protein